MYNYSAGGAGVIFFQILYQATPADYLQKKLRLSWNARIQGYVAYFISVTNCY